MRVRHGIGRHVIAAASIALCLAAIAQDERALRTTDARRVAEALRDRFAYYERAPEAHDDLTDDWIESVAGRETELDFLLGLQEMVARFPDGHGGVDDLPLPEGYLPFLVEPWRDEFVAFYPDRGLFLVEDYPILETIDGIPIEEWVSHLTPLITKGSKQHVQRQALRLLRHIVFVRTYTGVETTGRLRCQVRSLDGRRQSVELPISGAFPYYGTWPSTHSRLLEGNIGYLRIERMDDDAAARIAPWMLRFQETRGLIVDVRGNSGGTRDVSRAFLPCLMEDDGPPEVVSAAKYRLHPSHNDDHLSARYMYRRAWTGYTDAQRSAIDAFAASFKPVWEPPKTHFSEWHYFVISPGDREGRYHYARPVVVLMDAKCASATSVFLAALKGRPGVTLLGQPESGTSGFAQTISLESTRARVRLASMASYRPDGRLYEGNGVEPDVTVENDPNYFLIGGNDAVLKSAIARLTGE